MGSGKTTVGEVLAGRLNYNFIDLDLFIENKYKRSIKQMFSENGEKYFRYVESECLDEVSNLDDKYVVATGGGIVLSQSNWELMNNNGTTVYLEADLNTIWHRIEGDRNRPLLDVKDPLGEAEKLLDARVELYEKSDFVVKTDYLTAEQVAEEVIKIVKKSF